MRIDDDILLVEFHDARIDGVEVKRGGRMIIAFTRLLVHKAFDSSKDAVWAHAARLEVEDVVGFLMKGQLPDNGWVIADEIAAVDNDGTQRCLLAGASLTSIGLWFDNGACIEVTGGRAVLALSGVGEFVDYFDRESLG